MKPQPTLAIEARTARNPLTLGHELARTWALRETIGGQVSRLCFQMHGESLRAVVLTGSLARDEATLIEEKKSWRLLGDAEFLLIFQPQACLPAKVAMGFLRKNIETSISRLGIAGDVSISAAHPKYLRRMRPHIFAYELRNRGQVVGGDPQILTQIPGFSVTDIPLEDGWRLLSNRMVEQLEVLEGLEQRPKVLPRHLLYRTVKLYLDMATSFLLFAGHYAPTYAERARRLQALAETQRAHDKVPFDLRHFSDRVRECTRWKLSEIDPKSSAWLAPMGELGFSWWQEAVGYAQSLWRWELMRLAAISDQLPVRNLMKRWMALQPSSARLRGWMYVARKNRWLKSWRDWRRWARRGVCASPRYWIYAAAAELLHGLPELCERDASAADSCADWKELVSWLPMRHLGEAEGKPEWRQLAREIAWNYREYLEDTRA
jgi:hypothetical protein